MNDLRSKKFDEIEYFSFNGHECLVKIVDIYDGDTISIIFQFNQQYYKYRCRLCRINCEELHSSTSQKTEMANQSRIELARKILGEQVDLECKRNHLRELLNNHTGLNYCKFYEFDKYGRLLIELYESENTDSPNLNDFLITQGLASPY